MERKVIGQHHATAVLYEHRSEYHYSVMTIMMIIMTIIMVVMMMIMMMMIISVRPSPTSMSTPLS